MPAPRIDPKEGVKIGKDLFKKRLEAIRQQQVADSKFRQQSQQIAQDRDWAIVKAKLGEKMADQDAQAAFASHVDTKRQAEAKAQGQTGPVTKNMYEFSNFGPDRNDPGVSSSNDLFPEGAGMPPVGGTLPFMVERESMVRPEEVMLGVRRPVRTIRQTVKPNMMSAGEREGLIQQRAYNQARLGIEERRLKQEENQFKQKMRVDLYQDLISELPSHVAGAVTNSVLRNDWETVDDLVAKNPGISFRLNEARLRATNAATRESLANVAKADIESLAAAEALVASYEQRNLAGIIGFGRPDGLTIGGNATDGLDLKQLGGLIDNDVLDDKGQPKPGRIFTLNAAQREAYYRGYVTAYGVPKKGFSGLLGDKEALSIPRAELIRDWDRYLSTEDQAAKNKLLETGLFVSKYYEDANGKKRELLEPVTREENPIDWEIANAIASEAAVYYAVASKSRSQGGPAPGLPPAQAIPEEPPAVRAASPTPQPNITDVRMALRGKGIQEVRDLYERTRQRREEGLAKMRERYTGR